VIRATPRTLVVVNPRAGGGRGVRRWNLALADAGRALGPLDVRFTESVGDGRRIAREGVESGFTLIVAAGGDGTVSEVSDGILAAGGGAKLGIVPCGTGSDLARALGVPRDPRAAARRLADPRTRNIDAGRVRFADGSPDRHFVNCATFGVSGPTVARANASSKRLGRRGSYIAAALVPTFTYDPPSLRVAADGADLPVDVVFVATIGNSRFAGGGMQFCPDARLDDGALDISIVGPLSLFSRAVILPALLLPPAFTRGRLYSRRAARFEAAARDPSVVVTVELDGESAGRLPATFEVLPGALRVRC
jgi:YegS/Rv2252/BmrU family lipid kinase